MGGIEDHSARFGLGVFDGRIAKVARHDPPAFRHETGSALPCQVMERRLLRPRGRLLVFFLYHSWFPFWTSALAGSARARPFARLPAPGVHLPGTERNRPR